MVSKVLLGCWAFVDVWLLAAGVLSLIMSLVWKAPNLMINFTMDASELTAGTALGIMLLITFAISIFAIVQRNHVTGGLVLLNWVLIADSIAVIVIGTYIWFSTLQERNHYFGVWQSTTPDVRIQIQEKFQCCGYFLQNDTVEFTGFCANKTFVDTLVNATDPDQFRCVRPITAFTDPMLNNIFSSTASWQSSFAYS
ncbi:unnamed protein product [Somion occarium]|uniref:Tetraspanin n=2 Tax=Somion occarium TaxID=3059160 RepID=A0ABP1DAM4_9APHY